MTDLLNPKSPHRQGLSKSQSPPNSAPQLSTTTSHSYLSGFQPPAGFAVYAALMRTRITTHGSPPPQQQQRASRPDIEQRTMTAPTSSFPSRPALNSRSESSQSQSATRDGKEAVEYFPIRSPAADFQEPGHERGEGHAQGQGPGAPRTRSVQFSTPAAGMASSASAGNEQDDGGGGHGERYGAAESSGDEITPMVSRERGGGKGYDTTATSNSDSRPGDDVRSSSQGSGSNGMRRRAEKKRGSKASRGSGPGADEREGEEEEEGGWWAWTLEKFGSVELDNKGSVARDHLALERTFLAWLRTSLAFASIGIAITQLFRLNTTISKREGLKPADPSNSYHLRQLGKPLGATFLGIAILVLAIGGRRYFESQYWIIRGKFPASRGSIFLITFVAVALIITSLVVVITVDPTVYEKR